MRDIVLYDRSGQPVIYKDADTLKTDTTVEGETTIFTHGVVMNDVKIPLDFSSGGDQAISVPDGYLVREATIIKPEALKPENIKKDEVVAGVKGTLIGNMEEVTVDLDMAEGDQEIVPSTEDFLISKATIKKPDTLQGKNIVKDVVIGGVKGTHEGIKLDNLEVILPITEITVPENANGMVPIMNPIGLKSGQIYLVMWNNTGYVCKAQSAEFEGLPLVAIGNSLAWGGDDTGEPFAVGEFPAEVVSQTGGVYGGIIPLDGSTTFTAGGYFIGSDGYILDGFRVDLDFSSGDNQKVTLPDGYLIKEATIVKPETLIPENIAKGETVAGVVGTNKGPRLKPIRFYDPYGNVLESYTRAEIQEMTELPPGPPLGDLTFSKWTHTLEELQSVPYFADVGPCYQQNGADVIVVILDAYYHLALNSAPTIYLMLGKNVKATVNWGDGSTSTQQSSNYYANHAYTTPGRKIITIKPSSTSSTYIELGYYSTNYYSLFSTTTSYSMGAGTNIGGQPRDGIISILSGLSVRVDLVSCACNGRLKMLSSASNISVKGKGLANNPSLEIICSKDIGFTGSYGAARCLSLKRIPNVTNILYSNMFVECPYIEEMVFECTPDKLTNMNDQWAMLMTQTEPPTLTADTVRTWGTKPIYVPDSAVEAYKTADVWSTVADYIIPASQYPD